MARKNTSLAALKEKAAAHTQKAKAIQTKIREIENERFLEIGRFIAGFQKKNWEGFTTEILQKKVYQIMNS